MRRVITGSVFTLLSIGFAYAIPKLLEITGMITQESLVYSILIGIILFVATLGWWLYPTIKKRVEIKQGAKKMVNIGFVVLGIGVVSILASGFILLPRIKIHNEDTRTAIQIQTDSLIADITAYSKTVPSMPMPLYSNDPVERDKLWNEFNKQLTDYYSKLNSDFFC